jgi:hypothetical protein
LLQLAALRAAELRRFKYSATSGSKVERLSIVKPSCNLKPEGDATFFHFGLFRVNAA